jgi:hypothetical protein
VKTLSVLVAVEEVLFPIRTPVSFHFFLFETLKSFLRDKFIEKLFYFFWEHEWQLQSTISSVWVSASIASTTSVVTRGGKVRLTTTPVAAALNAATRAATTPVAAPPTATIGGGGA